MAEWIHNTRVSPSIKAVPWSLTYANPYRSDLFPLQIVSVVNSTRVSASKAVPRIFLGLAGPTKAVVWAPRIEKAVEVVHPTKLRTIRPSVEFLLSHYGCDEEGVAVLGSLAATSARLPPGFRVDPRWAPAVAEHANKLLSMVPPPLTKLVGPLPPGVVPDRSFFTGQERDGQFRARLVVDNGSCGSDSDVYTNDLPCMLERLSLLSKMEALRDANPAWSVGAGDVSGAYYATRAEGYLRLPKDWPPGLGGMNPSEIVKSNCAMPGSRLGSGLFLTQLDSCLPTFPRTHHTIREGPQF